MKCVQYWPEEEKDCLQYGDITITNTAVQKFAFYTISTLLLERVRYAATTQLSLIAIIDYEIISNAVLCYRDQCQSL